MHIGTCFLCGRNGMLEDHHVFSGPFRQKSDAYGLIIGLCGDSCHRNGQRSVHRCRETADSVKQHWQIRFMQEYGVSVYEFIRMFGRNYLNENQYDDERSSKMNVAAISGRLTREPELRRTSEGVAVCSFCIAVDRPGVKDKTDFIECVAWRQKAEFVSKFFKKGQRIEVSGPVTSRKFEKNGEKRVAVEIICDNVFFGESKKADAENNLKDAEGNDFEVINDDADTTVPF